MTNLRDTITSARFPHPHYKQALSSIKSRITFMPAGSVVGVVGPPRVGKSVATREAARQVYPVHDVGKLPYAIVDCSRTDAGFASMRYLTLDLLAQLDHPFFTDEAPKIRTSQTETNARLQLRRAITHRGTKLLIFDEAHHLLRIKNRAGQEAALESLKCLGNETGALILLVGGYELLGSCFCSAHLNGRLSLIHFPRYLPVEDQVSSFLRILASFDQLLPWAKGHSLVAMKDFIYAGTLGSCGLISIWALIAIAEMTAAGDSKLRKEHFCNARYQRQVDEIARDIAFGESVLRTLPSSAPVSPPQVEAQNRNARQKRRPGRRNPGRDKVGGGI